MLYNTTVDPFCNELVHSPSVRLVSRYFFFFDWKQILKFYLWQIQDKD